MKHVRINADHIKDWDSFFDVFDKTFGFPAYFGRNMNAWIDCMTNLDEDGCSEVRVDPGEIVCVSIDNAANFKARCLDQYEALVECAGFVNWRRMEIGQPPILVVSFYV